MMEMVEELCLHALRLELLALDACVHSLELCFHVELLLKSELAFA